MVTITKRMRLWRGVPKTEADLERFRAQTRETLNKPFHFEAKPAVKNWDDGSTDPLDGPFKPFSKLVTPLSPAHSATVRQDLAQVNPRRLVLPIGVGVLALAGLLLWQVFGTLSSYNGIISPTPRSVQVKSVPTPAAVEPASSNVVPSGTQLQPGGPYTGTGGPEPTAAPTSGPTNVSSTGSAPTNLTPAPAAAPTCPAGMTCSGTALDGSPCTTANPCRVVYSTTPIITATQLIQSGSTTAGQPCSITNPCVLTH